MTPDAYTKDLWGLAVEAATDGDLAMYRSRTTGEWTVEAPVDGLLATAPDLADALAHVALALGVEVPERQEVTS